MQINHIRLLLFMASSLFEYQKYRSFIGENSHKRLVSRAYGATAKKRSTEQFGILRDGKSTENMVF